MYRVLLASIVGIFDSLAEIPYMFKKAGCNVDVFCSSHSWLRTNQFHDKWIETSENEDEFRSNLLNLVGKDPDHYNWIVLLDDATIKLMNECIDDPWLFNKILPLTKMENRALLSSKLGLSRVCEKYGIDTPTYLIYDDEMDLATIAAKLEFPILLKEDYSFSGMGIQFCETLSQLPGCLRKVRITKNVVLQEFIEGHDIGVEALFKEGELITFMCAEILTYMYDRFSFTTRRRYSHSEALAGRLQTLGRAIGLDGFANIQYIHHPQRNIYYLVEVDARTNIWMPYSRFTTNDFSNGIRRITKGDISYAGAPEKSKPVEIAIFDRDIRRCIKQKDYKGLLRWLVDYRYWKYIPLYDRKIMKRLLKKLLHDFARRHEKARRSAT
jgi:predicted ATP-grasp superfamily ATP-dependent carboligase